MSGAVPAMCSLVSPEVDRARKVPIMGAHLARGTIQVDRVDALAVKLKG
jgi:hypothetical protein